jgi:hypothetical protein
MSKRTPAADALSQALNGARRRQKVDAARHDQALAQQAMDERREKALNAIRFPANLLASEWTMAKAGLAKMGDPSPRLATIHAGCREFAAVLGDTGGPAIALGEITADRVPGAKSDGGFAIAHALLDLALGDKLTARHVRDAWEAEPRALGVWLVAIGEVLTGERELAPAPEAEEESSNQAAEEVAATEGGTLDQYICLDQAASIVNRTKKTLERYLNDPKSKAVQMPPPDVEGGGGKPHEWRWRRLRPWLETTFGKRLPEQLPSRGSRPPI